MTRLFQGGHRDDVRPPLRRRRRTAQSSDAAGVRAAAGGSERQRCCLTQTAVRKKCLLPPASCAAAAEAGRANGSNGQRRNALPGEGREELAPLLPALQEGAKSRSVGCQAEYPKGPLILSSNQIEQCRSDGTPCFRSALLQRWPAGWPAVAVFPAMEEGSKLKKGPHRISPCCRHSHI